MVLSLFSWLLLVKSKMLTAVRLVFKSPLIKTLCTDLWNRVCQMLFTDPWVYQPMFVHFYQWFTVYIMSTIIPHLCESKPTRLDIRGILWQFLWLILGCLQYVEIAIVYILNYNVPGKIFICHAYNNVIWWARNVYPIHSGSCLRSYALCCLCRPVAPGKQWFGDKDIVIMVHVISHLKCNSHRQNISSRPDRVLHISNNFQ